MKKPQILVVGSLNMDLSISMDTLPKSGETILGGVFRRAAGGKGANQAVQAARLGAHVTMVGKVGEDSFGQELISCLRGNGIDTRRIFTSSTLATGTAIILLETQKEQKSHNRIIVASGANMDLTSSDLEWLEAEISQFDMVMLQLEIPLEINHLVARYAKDAGVPVMLNSAPAAPLSDEFLACLSYISPNEHEAAHLTGITIRNQGQMININDAVAAAQILRSHGVANVIVTLGSGGAIIADGDGIYHSPCVDVVEVKDPTAAGDSFVGAFCTGVCAGLNHRQALDFASYVAALTVSRLGAQPSLPTLEEVVALMRRECFEGFSLSLLATLQ